MGPAGLQGPPGEAGAPRRTLTEIGLTSHINGNFVSSREGPVCGFLWEPHRYDPLPTEAYFEVYGSGYVTFWLQDMSTNQPISGSEITLSTQVVVEPYRVRSTDFAAFLPTVTTEMQMMARIDSEEFWSTQRAVVLLQQ